MGLQSDQFWSATPREIEAFEHLLAERIGYDQERFAMLMSGLYLQAKKTDGSRFTAEDFGSAHKKASRYMSEEDKKLALLNWGIASKF